MDQKISPQIPLDQFLSQDTDSIRQELFGGSDLRPACRACDTAHATRRSVRTTYYDSLGWNTENPQPQLRDLTLALDNICASSCLACSPRNSTSIAQLSNQLPSHGVQWFSRTSQPTAQINLAMLEPYLDQLQIIQVYGGEPLFSPQWLDFIELCNRMPNLQAVALTTGLNRIKKPHVAALAQLAQRIKVGLTVSIDAPLEYNHWIRDCSPEQVQTGLDLISTVPVSRLNIQPVIANYNIFALPELVQVVHDIVPGHFFWSHSPIWDPIELRPSNLPPDIKNAVVAKLSAAMIQSPNSLYRTAIELMTMPKTVDWKKSVARIELLPKLRGCTENFDYWLHKYL